MIYDIQYSGFAHSRDHEINELLKVKKQNNSTLSVIDVGASLNPWCNHITAVVDINSDKTDKYLKFSGNINQFEVWEDVLSYVAKHGKFDFSICTHTLEDISNPIVVSHMLSKISKEGFVAVPSKYVESKRLGAICRGWLHHRWIFNPENNKVIAYPKLPFTEYLNSLDIVSKQSDLEELSFQWSGSCDIEAVNNDFFPSEHDAIDMYNRLID